MKYVYLLVATSITIPSSPTKDSPLEVGPTFKEKKEEQTKDN